MTAARAHPPLTGQRGHRASTNRLVPAAGILAVGVGAYVALIRPWQLRWGATGEEVHKTLPGDDIVPRPRYATTRAVTIAAPAAEVWRWLVQLGQGRGGFYSYDRLENLFRLDIHSADRIDPALQSLRVGDFVAAAPNEAGGWVVAALAPQRLLVLRLVDPRTKRPSEAGDYVRGGVSGSWVFVVEPIAPAATRLIARWRSDWAPSLPATLFNALLIEPAHFVMERAMLRGIKQRAERAAWEQQRTTGREEDRAAA